MLNYNYASIDVGSNSINLLLAEIESKKIISQNTESFITELGSGISETGAFSRTGMENAYNAFSEIYMRIKQYKIPLGQVVCVATEASRVAFNSEEFYARIKKDFSIETKIISAEDEALFSMMGVVPNDVEETLVLDLGGASTELIYVRNGKIVTFKSFKIGAVNISKDFTLAGFEQFSKSIGFNQHIILVGGTAATIAASYLGSKAFDAEAVNNLIIELSSFQTFANGISAIPESEIKKKYPLTKKRIASIKNGVGITLDILNIIQPKTIRFSSNGVRQGALLELIDL
jgi:exopolyphosphatase / guanosine-5'-triphosphate,3'-diphosphate pyrophosphatase